MPSLGMLTINTLAAAYSVVIPTQPHYLSAKGLELLLRSVSKVRRKINPPLRIDGILTTMVMLCINISKEVTALVKSNTASKSKSLNPRYLILFVRLKLLQKERVFLPMTKAALQKGGIKTP